MRMNHFNIHSFTVIHREKDRNSVCVCLCDRERRIPAVGMRVAESLAGMSACLHSPKAAHVWALR